MSRCGRRSSGALRRRSRLRARWTVRPTQSSGRSEATQVAPAANNSTNTPSPMIVAASRSGSIPPRRIAGSASTGRASTTAIMSRLAAVNPAAACPGGVPDATSMRYCSAAPIAPPPGAILASELPASWEAITGRQAGAWIAIRCSHHVHASAAAWRTAITASQASGSSTI